MKKIISLACLICSYSFVQAQVPVSAVAAADTSLKVKIVEASCGSCKFGMKVKGCALAVRIDGKPYLVDGALLDNYGDAHEDDGMCNAIRKAEVSGEIKGDKYVATSFKLLPVEKAKE